MVRAELTTRRQDAVKAWTSFVEHGDHGSVRPEIWSSWTRSLEVLDPDVSEAPLADEGEVRSFWRDSPLQVAIERVEEDLRRTAEDGDLVASFTQDGMIRPLRTTDTAIDASARL